MDVNPGDRFIYISLLSLASKLTVQLTEQEQSCILGVGTSGSDFANLVSSGPPKLSVETIEFNRERDKRSLLVPEFIYRPVIVDDIAVSGLTLSYARQRISPTPETAAVGMLYRSKTTKRRSGFNDIRAGVVYFREGGGNPPINSIATLKSVPERLEDIAERYFRNSAEEFTDIIKEMK